MWGQAGSGFFSDEEVDICSGYNHPAVVVQPFFLLLIGVGLAKQECIIKYLLLYYYYYYYYYLINLKKLMFLEVDHSHQKLI